MLERISSLVAAIPDFPLKGIIFRDVTPVLADPQALRACVDLLAERLQRIPGGPPEAIVGIESRGFIFGAPLAIKLGVGFLPVRKPGKLPRRTLRAEYMKEYGTDVLEMHEDAIKPGQRVAIVDDLLATGGTAEATARLLQESGGKVAAYAFLIELDTLRGRDRLLRGVPVEALLHY
ncbi:MAG: adenine phosphoribosyltransferase [Myxococcota bacterium]